MKQTTKRFISMIVSLFLIIGAIILYFDFIQPAYDDAQKIKSEDLGERLFLDGEKSAIEQVQRLISTYQGQGGAQQAVSLSLPATEDLAGALAQLNGLADESGLSAQSFSVSVLSLQKPVESGGLGQKNLGAELNKPLGAINFQIKASGSYQALKNFISMIETNMRIFDVKSFNIQPIFGTQGKAVQDLYAYDLAVATYYQAP